MSKKTKEYSSTYERLIHEDPEFEKDLNIKVQGFSSFRNIACYYGGGSYFNSKIS